MNKLTPSHTLGIIVSIVQKGKHPPFSEEPFFRQLAQEGAKYGIEVCVFHPKMIHWKTRSVTCWHFSQEHWRLARKPLPTLIYDRCFYSNSAHYRRLKPYVKRIESDPAIRLLGKALGGKLQTYQILKLNEKLLPYLPPTQPVHSPNDVFDFFKQKNQHVLLKPNGGSHGCGVVVISRQQNGYLARGRSKKNQPFAHWFSSDRILQQWLSDFIGSTRYILQPFLSLRTPDHRPFDVRILVQKNEQKNWEITGMAIRTGKPHTITSNLHGGGEAVSIKHFLEKHYSKESVASILSQIESISQEVPPHMETHHGPLVELGLDIGIDTEEKIWILEVNSKPGRSIFIKTGEWEIRQRAVQLPIHYAHALLTSS